MCGILAVIGKHRYNEIPEALRERGLDDEGMYQDEFVQLIQTRLQITGGKVKLPYEWKNYVLLFNGEVYNWKDFSGKNEYESILMAYDKGLDLNKVLDGQFAIIIYDKEKCWINYYLDELRIHALYVGTEGESTILSSNLRSLPKIEFNQLQDKGYGNITKQGFL